MMFAQLSKSWFRTRAQLYLLMKPVRRGLKALEIVSRWTLIIRVSWLFCQFCYYDFTPTVPMSWTLTSLCRSVGSTLWSTLKDFRMDCNLEQTFIIYTHPTLQFMTGLLRKDWILISLSTLTVNVTTSFSVSPETWNTKHCGLHSSIKMFLPSDIQ